MNFREIPLVFDCQGSRLIGMAHVPDTIRTRGMLSVVAGGPQYRGGVCRMQVQMARALAQTGVPVMRFDYRGMGDSEGSFRGFQDVEADLSSAIQAFQQRVPGLNEIVLWGGCDAASAILINAWKFPAVTGMVVGNPWVHSDDTGDVVAIKHYSRRLHDRDFWLKLVRLQYNPLPAIATVARGALLRLRSLTAQHPAPAETAASDDLLAPHLDRMRNGLARYEGDLLLLMSGRSLVSKEFDELVASQPGWQQALRSQRHFVRHDMPDADQAFSSVASRAEAIAVTGSWMLDRHAMLTPADVIAAEQTSAPK